MVEVLNYKLERGYTLELGAIKVEIERRMEGYVY